MKKILFLLSFFLVVGVNANAQKKACAKTCAKTCASKAKTASTDDAKTTSVASAYMVADEAAAANEAIEKRVCAKSGSVSYYEKAVCEKSGKVSFNEVTFDSEANQFVNLSPLETGDVKADMKKISSETKSCAAGCTKACCAGVSKKACSKMSKAECAKKCSGKKKTGA